MIVICKFQREFTEALYALVHMNIVSKSYFVRMSFHFVLKDSIVSTLMASTKTQFLLILCARLTYTYEAIANYIDDVSQAHTIKKLDKPNDVDLS